jgi:hypothetical protein
MQQNPALTERGIAKLRPDLRDFGLPAAPDPWVSGGGGDGAAHGDGRRRFRRMAITPTDPPIPQIRFHSSGPSPYAARKQQRET